MRQALETILAVIIVPGGATILVPMFILSRTGRAWPPRFGLAEAAAVLGVMIGAAMVLWVSYVFVSRGRGTPIPVDPPRRFVAEGLFRYVRNPMYLGALLILFSEALFFRSWWLFVYASGIWVFFHLGLLLWEEPQLKRRFGQSYGEYLSATPRWIPRNPRPGAGTEQN